MLKLENIKKDDQIIGIIPNETVKIVTVDAVGSDAITIYYKKQSGELFERMLFRSDEEHITLAQKNRLWSLDASPEDFKLALEAYRISEAALFDPMMAVHTSNVEPLPHQISAVYEAMLPKQPLRFVLADDPGAGKTIMAGLLIRELLMRSDAKRILIVSPGSLSGQWQDELNEKFGIDFEILSKEKYDLSSRHNFFEDNDLLICRLDQLSRNEELQEKLKQSEWDLIIVDEAHKLSANFFGGKVNKTKRFILGELLGSITRHFLLMTATPHNGKEEDFQTWLSLLDSDRFYGKFREGVHKVDISDMMRRMVKEELLKFDGTLLFPERKAYTANYTLSPIESSLYTNVTDYVRNEMNKAEDLDGNRKGTVGFALTQLQRRLASSPKAIYESLKRRRNKLEERLNEEKIAARSSNINKEGKYNNIYKNSIEDEDDLSAEEYEIYGDNVVDQATASESISDLQAEILILKDLEQQALDVITSNSDKKWEQLSSILQDNKEMFLPTGNRRKMIIFTEHKDTLNYLKQKISDLLGVPESVVIIHGGTNRDERRKVQEEFRNNPTVLVLIATDAAGEGVNLQNANLMVNYDLPWNPNRLEQRFGRIHRIGQTEVCHLWNMVANETREGEVFKKLFDKLEIEKKALGGKVFDILGEAFSNISLKDLLIEAIRYGDSPETRNKMNEVIDNSLDTDHLKEIIKRNALVDQHMGLQQLYSIKEEMEKAEARKLQPYFVRAFFVEAFQKFQGEMRSRENGRYEIRHVPAVIRERDRTIGETRTPVLKQYERVCFEKGLIRQPNKAMAELIHPKHPLMHSVIDLTLEAHRSKLKQGTILLDPNDETLEPKMLFMISHSVKEGGIQSERIISRRLKFVQIDKKGEAQNAGYAPHLDLQLLTEADFSLIQHILSEEWLQNDLDNLALDYAAKNLVYDHYQEIKSLREVQSSKIHAAVHERLTKEINYQYGRAIKLEEDVKNGKQPQVQPENFKRRAEELTARLQQRKKELEQMKNVISSTPVVKGGALIIPQGLINHLKGNSTFSVDTASRTHIERKAMQAVMMLEESLGHTVSDVSDQKCGWDITSRPRSNADGSIQPDRHIEVKGRAKGQSTITVTRNEIIYALNQSDKFILAIVIVDGDSFEGPYYIRNPFNSEPDFSVTSINYDLEDLLKKAEKF